MYAHVRIAALLGFALTTSRVMAQSSLFEAGPYLSQLTSHSVVVRAETDAAETLSVTVTTSAAPALEASDAEALKGMHSLPLEGLQPKTTYRYTVTGSRGGSEDGSFTTAPADDDASPTDIRFILFGDDRGNATIHQAIVKDMLGEPADFLVNTGDLVADGRSASLWKGFFEIENALLRERCLFAAIGNHDLVEESGASFLRYFGSGDEQKNHVFNTTFRWGFIRFFMLNGEGAFDGSDKTWLDRSLKAADSEPGLAWRVVVIHDGPFASGLHGDNDKMQSAAIPQLFREHHVDFVLEGHDHIYERGVSDGMRYIVSGGAGAPLYPIKHQRPTARKLESAYHYVLLDFARDKGTLTTKRVDGSVLEKVGFSKTSFWDDDLPNAPAVTPASSTAQSTPLGPAAVSPEEERKASSYGVPYAAAGVAVIGALWFWLARRRKKPGADR
jgi:acid phosphatase type 7